MIPAEFDYVAPDTLDEALSALSAGGEDAKLIAGGHSLLPLMKLRLAAPTLLVDLRKVPDLSGVSNGSGVTIGAMTTHTVIANADLGLISEVSSTIADPQVRNRGTLGGSLAHGDPASDQPAILLAFEGSVTVRGASGEVDGRGDLAARPDDVDDHAGAAACHPLHHRVDHVDVGEVLRIHRGLPQRRC